MADCSVTIVTGDSVLTACHVAREVGLIDEIDAVLGRPGKGKGKKNAGKTGACDLCSFTYGTFTRCKIVCDEIKLTYCNPLETRLYSYFLLRTISKHRWRSDTLRPKTRGLRFHLTCRKEEPSAVLLVVLIV